jgi:hypothetical protein
VESLDHVRRNPQLLLLPCTGQIRKYLPAAQLQFDLWRRPQAIKVDAMPIPKSTDKTETLDLLHF